MTIIGRLACLLSPRQPEGFADRRASAAAADLREIGLGLLGRSETMDRAEAEAVAAGARAVLTIADELAHDRAAPTGRRIMRETLALDSLVGQAVEAVTAHLAPGRRHWRVHPSLAGAAVWADRRATRYVLGAVLASAARGTRQDDCIEVRSSRDGPGFVVEDEGAGNRADGVTDAPGRIETRGIGLGLAVARTLMEAHGGSLMVESVPGVGNRVIARFPPGPGGI